MRLVRLTKGQRERQRRQRQERDLILAMVKARNFDYYVNPPPTPRVAFGTSLERDVLPLKGPSLSPFMKKMQGEILEYPGPFEHYVYKGFAKKLPSNKGHKVFTSKLPRLPPTQTSAFPPIGSYDIRSPRGPPKPNSKPFGVGYTPKETKFLTPGPASYPIHEGLRKLEVTTCFGKKRITKSFVQVICSPSNTAMCHKCLKLPVGDYWRNYQTEQDMCRNCMKMEQSALKQCSTDTFVRIRKRRELDQFKPTRYCGFYHEHNGTTAAERLLSKSTLNFKINKENYLSRYM